MNIVIPAAGRGQRFIDAGYKEPKPLILVDGHPMIEKVIYELVDDYDIKFHIIHNKDHNIKGNICKNVPKDEFDSIFNFISVDQVTEGAACSVLLAKEWINNDRQLLIANCDQTISDPIYLREAIYFFKRHNADAGIICFLNDSPKWSYAKIENGTIVEVAEKKPISNLATVGIYWFKKGSDFVQNAEEMITSNDRTNLEFYVCPVFNYLIKKNLRVLPYMVNNMYGLGTPEDLKKYNERNNAAN